MKKIILILFAIIAAAVNNSTAQLNLNWGYSIGSAIDNQAKIYASAICTNNSVVACGIGDSTLDFNPGIGITNLNNLWFSHFIAKYDTSANLIFARSLADTIAGGWPGSSYFKLLSDNLGNSYLILGLSGSSAGFTGIGWNINGIMNYDSIPNGRWRNILLKFDSAGNCMYVKKIAFNVTVIDAIIDHNDNLIICGNFSGTKDLAPGPPVQMFSTTYEDAFFTKLDSTGNIVYINVIHCINASPGSGGFALIGPASLAVDSQDNLFFYLYLEGVYDLDPSSDSNIVHAPYASNPPINGNSLLEKWDSSGNFIFKKKFFQTGFGFDIKIDAYDKLYLAGSFSAPFDIDPGPDTVILSPPNYVADAVIAQFTNNGNYVFSKQITGTNYQAVRNFHITQNNKYFLLAVTRIDSTAFASLGIPNVGQSSSYGKQLIIETDSMLNAFYFHAISNSFDTNSYYPSGIMSDVLDNIYLFGSYRGSFDADFNSGIYYLNNPFASQYTESCLLSKYSSTNNLSNLNSENSNNSLCVFPNPFCTAISIYTKKQNIKQLTITIKDILGHKVFSNRENNLSNIYIKTIDLNLISKGIYLLDVTIDGERTVKKIVKE